MDQNNSLSLPPCNECEGSCCQYFSLELDRPTTLNDFENIKWYILHEKTQVYVDDGHWYLQVFNPCRFLGDNNKCQVYEQRPSICREYGWDDDQEVHCDYTTKNISHDAIYRHPKDIDKLIRKRFPRAKQYSQVTSYPKE